MDYYKPSQEILDKYADVLVRFGLNSGKGIKRGDVVYLEVPECAKQLLISLQKSVLKAGAHYITNFIPDEAARHFYELAEEHQLNFFAEKHWKAKVEQADHLLSILAETNKKELKGISPKKIMARQSVHKPYMDWRHEKENRGKLSWTLGLYGTEAMAKEAGLSLKEYWDQIIKACYLDREDPIAEWKKAFVEINRLKKVLNDLNIKKLRIKSEHNNLTIGLGKNRQWLGGNGANIPSFEVFISPDWRLTEGHIYVDQPLYRYGNLIKNIHLEFREGKVVSAKADIGEDFLKEMIATENADKIGEFSLTDKRLSKIDKFMAETLFDENFGGKYGNTHIALGRAYTESYPGDVSKFSKKDWDKMGYNDSIVHTDVVSTENREVYAELEDGKEVLIYKDGMFLI